MVTVYLLIETVCTRVYAMLAEVREQLLVRQFSPFHYVSPGNSTQAVSVLAAGVMTCSAVSISQSQGLLEMCVYIRLSKFFSPGTKL